MNDRIPPQMQGQMSINEIFNMRMAVDQLKETEKTKQIIDKLDDVLFQIVSSFIPSVH